MSRILTTHVGSLPRGTVVSDFLFARERGEAFDQVAYDAAMEAGTLAVLARQAEIGIDIPSDGETSKIRSRCRPTSPCCRCRPNVPN